MPERSDRVLTFEGITLDLDAVCLRRDGEVVAVEPQVFDLIVFLADNAGRVVDRDEIIEAVWHGRIVSDSAIATRINAARRALGDDGKTQRFIKTVHGRGFRFMDKVDSADSEATDAALDSPDRPSIAVLPFVNISGDAEQEYFADGMTEDVITGLSRFRSLFVTARNSSFAYKGTSPDVRAVARDLGVRYLLEGAVRSDGNRVRITAQLVDGQAGTHLWAERYDREMASIFAIQDEVTDAIVAAIAPEIGEVERARARRDAPGDLDAWGLYQRGLNAFYSSTAEGLLSAIDIFDQANALDAGFAPAFAMGAGARWRYAMHFDPEDRAAYLDQALAKAYAAIERDPRDAAGHWNAASAHGMLDQHDTAIAKVEEAIALNPNDAMARYMLGSVLRRAGRGEEAIANIDHAMRLSPRDIWLTGMLTDRAFVLFDQERYEDALTWARRARLSPNPRTMTFAVFAAVLSKLGHADEARAAVKDLMAHAPGISRGKYRNNHFGLPAVMERLAASLSEAGLPD